MEKYYTPALEEFHIGFEYEICIYDSTVMNGMGGNIYIEENYDAFTYLNKYNNIFNIDLNRIRVKYLDREDIASLGFEHLGSGWFKKGDYRIRKWVQQQVDIYLWEEDEHHSDGDIIFRGNIKNKSELKQILTQLNIN